MAEQHDENARPLHRIVVEQDEDGPTSVRFICDGDDSAQCHHWPSCDCEVWGGDHGDPWRDEGDPLRDPKPGHENVQQPYCWIDPWFNEALGHQPFDWVDAWDGDGPEPNTDENPLVSGYIETYFEGDFMTWEYAAEQPRLRPGLPGGDV